MATYTSQYPPAQNGTYVKATSYYDNYCLPYFATDPTKSLINGQDQSNIWASGNLQPTNQRFHIDLGSAKVIKRIYYENNHHYGLWTDGGAKSFTFWGSNNSAAFATLTYGTDTGWTQISTSQAYFDRHIAANQADAKYITLINSTAYRYYAIKIADGWGSVYYVSLRRIVLQTEDTPTVVVPTVTVDDAYSIDGDSAITIANIVSAGGENASAIGVCWNTTGAPTIADSVDQTIQYQAFHDGYVSWALDIAPLVAGTKYYYRAFATNSAGTGYSDVKEFTTLDFPTITTTAISGIGATSATGGGNITDAGGDTVSARGVCWSTAENPTTANSKTSDGTGTGAFASSITGLKYNTTYYVRAYATNSLGTAYGSKVSFTTLGAPLVATQSPATKITKGNALIQGKIISTGGVSPTVRGICWNTTGNPTTADDTAYDTGTFYAGAFSKYASGLTARTTYYVRAYATNSIGTAYGDVISFTTLSRGADSPQQTSLRDTFFIGRSSIYASPLNTNDALPIVYGDLTDGVNGNWQLPCIDTLTDGGVYCYADHEVLSVANGNSIAVYKDGALVSSSDYTFDEANDYEGEGVIATIIFDAGKSPGNSEISVRGKGKPIASGGATLMTNIIDIIEDFLLIECNFPSDIIDATYRATAAYTFRAQGYLAAGVIDEDIATWDILQAMMASFLGSVYLNGEGKINLEIDDGTLPAESFRGILSTFEANFISASQSLDNLVNQFPALYCFDYVVDQFKYITDTVKDIASQDLFGVRKPKSSYEFYWCRNLASIEKIQDILIDKFKYPVWTIEVDDITMKRLDCDILKVVSYTAKNLFDEFGNPLINQLWKVLSFNPNFTQGKIGFKLMQTGFYMTVAYIADGTYLADGSILAGDNRNLMDY